MPPIDQLMSLYQHQGWNDPNSIKADIQNGGWQGKINNYFQPTSQGYQAIPNSFPINNSSQQGFNPMQFLGNMGQQATDTLGAIGNWGVKQATNLANNVEGYHPDNAVSSPGFVTGTPDWIKPIIQRASVAHNIPTVLLSALLKQESGFNPQAKSPVGALGVAQFMPGTAAGRKVNPLDPESSVNGAAQYLSEGMQKYQGDPKKALAAYNAGFGAVDRFQGVPPYPETQNYVKNILAMAGEPHATAYQPVLDIQNQAKKQSQSQTPY